MTDPPASVGALPAPPAGRALWALGEVLDWLVLLGSLGLLAWAAAVGLTFLPSAEFTQDWVPLLWFERVALALGAAAVVRRLLGGRVLPHAPLVAMGMAGLVCLLSLGHTTILDESRNEVFYLFPLFVLILAALMSLGSPAKTHVVLAGPAALALGEALVGMGQYVSGTPTPAYWLSGAFAAVIPTRLYGTLGSPNVLAGFLLIGIASAAILAISLPWPWRSLPAGALAVQVAALTLTFSRGGYIGVAVFVAAAAVFTWPARRQSWPVLLLILIVAAAVGTALPIVGVRAASSIAPRVEDTLTSRLFIWRTAMAMWRAHPVWGAGIGTFNAAYTAFRPHGVLATYALLRVPGSAHDDYLQVLATTGLAGVGLLAAGLLWGAWRAWRRYAGGGPGDRAWIGAWGAGILGVGAMSVVDENLFVVTNVTALLLSSAAVASHVSSDARLPVPLSRRLLVLPLGVVLAVLPPLLASPVKAFMLHEQATHEVTEGRYTQAVETFRAAMAADPLNGFTPAYFGDLLADLYIRRVDNAMGPWQVMQVRAREMYMYAMLHSPYDAYPRAQLGRLDRLEGRYPQAIARFREAIRLDSYTPEYRLQLAEVYLLAGDRAGAARQLRAAVRLFPLELLALGRHEGRDARFRATAAQFAEAQRLYTSVEGNHGVVWKPGR